MVILSCTESEFSLKKKHENMLSRSINPGDDRNPIENQNSADGVFSLYSDLPAY